MKNRQNEFVIGLSVAIATIIVIMAVLWLGKSNFLVKGLHLQMVIENANGIGVGDAITYRGLNVGSIRSTSFSDSGVVLDLKLEGIEKIPTDSRFVIKELNLLGEMAVEIQPGREDKNLENLAYVKGYSASSISSLTSNGKALRKTIDEVLANIDSLSGKQNLAQIHLLFQRLNITMRDLDQMLRVDVKHILSNLDQMSAESRAPLQKTLQTLAEKSKNMAEGIENLQSITEKLDRILGKIDNGDGTLGKLLNDGKLYDNTNSAIQSIDSLATDMKRNPKKYFEVKIL